MKAMKPESHTPAFKNANYFCRGNDGDHLYNDFGNDVLSKLGIDECDFTKQRNNYKAHYVQHNLDESDKNRLDYSLARNAFEQTYQYYRSVGIVEGEEESVIKKLNELLDKLFESAVDKDVEKLYRTKELPEYASGSNKKVELDHSEDTIDEIKKIFSEIKINIKKDIRNKVASFTRIIRTVHN